MDELRCRDEGWDCDDEPLHPALAGAVIASAAGVGLVCLVLILLGVL